MGLAIYRLFLYLAFPVILVRMAIRIANNRQYLSRLPQRFGFAPLTPKPNGVWIHSVSVGEVNAAVPLIQHILKTDPDIEIIVTTMTPTGSDRVRKLFSKRVHHCYLPYDYPGAMKRFIRSINPCLAIVMETEIWPNMIHVCHQQKIPMIYTNVRLSARSYERYGRFKAIIAPTLKKVSEFAVQCEPDAKRLIGLGASADNVHITGNIKFDMRLPASVIEAAQSVRRRLGWSRPVWVVGSTHEGEEPEVLDAFATAKKEIPDLLLILVPRHPERFSAVFRLCTRWGFNVSLRSENVSDIDSSTEVYLGDTMGELTLLIAAGDVAFIGGSLVPTGGHNLLEASAAGIPVIFGPHIFNFAEIADLVLAKGAGVQIMNSDELGEVVVKLLNDSLLRDQYGARGRELIEENKGALKKIRVLFEKHLRH